jgi:hypothetical protein
MMMVMMMTAVMIVIVSAVTIMITVGSISDGDNCDDEDVKSNGT